MYCRYFRSTHNTEFHVKISPKNLSRFTQNELDCFFKQARSILKNSALTLLMAPKQKKDYGRILVITSRKVGNAPTRNTIRRRIKSLFYEQGYYEQGYDCVAIIKKEGAHLSFAVLQALFATTPLHQKAPPSCPE